MKRKFLIYSNQPYQEETRVYYKSTTFKSSDWDAYGSNPAKTIHWAMLIQDAMLFDTREAAQAVIHNHIDDLTNVDSKYIHVIQITDKQLFKATLAGK